MCLLVSFHFDERWKCNELKIICWCKNENVPILRSLDLGSQEIIGEKMGAQEILVIKNGLPSEKVWLPLGQSINP